ncbi:MAG: methyltransferase family protein [Fimbriiglobus sp.]
MRPLPTRARVARPAPVAVILAKTAGQMVVFWTIFFGLIPLAVWHLESAVGLAWWRFLCPTAEAVGIGVIVAGGALGITCAVLMAVHGRGTPLPTDCASELVVVGPYRFVRNPMAIAGLAQGVAVGVVVGSPAVMLYAATGIPVWNWFVRPWEEADLEARFGDPYRRYRVAVRCWVPRRRGFDPALPGAGGSGRSPRAT